MAELQATSNEYTLDTIAINVKDADLDLLKAREMAKAKARDMDNNAMMLSGHGCIHTTAIVVAGNDNMFHAQDINGVLRRR